MCLMIVLIACIQHHSVSVLQVEVEVELEALLGQQGAVENKMLALQRMGYVYICGGAPPIDCHT